MKKAELNARIQASSITKERVDLEKLELLIKQLEALNKRTLTEDEKSVFRVAYRNGFTDAIMSENK